MSDSMIQMILNENDALILSLETILESEEKYQKYSYEYPSTMIYHDFLTLIEETEQNLLERLSEEQEEEEKECEERSTLVDIEAIENFVEDEAQI